MDTRAEHEKGYKRFLKAVDEVSREGDTSADSLFVTRGTAHSAQGKNEVVVSVACESSTDPAIDITLAIKTDLKERKIWTVVDSTALYEEDR